MTSDQNDEGQKYEYEKRKKREKEKKGEERKITSMEVRRE